MDLVPSVRAAVLDPELPIDDVATLGQRGSDYVRLPRFYALTIGAFAAVALVLAATGIAGVTAYSVSQRSREIGLRMALGAGRGRVLGLILGRTGRLIALGLLLGLAGAFVLTRYLDSLLFEVTPFDPATFGAAALALLLVAAAAAYVPARQASRLDPAETLRQE
jgi:putative ABC transport system permease protein